MRVILFFILISVSISTFAQDKSKENPWVASLTGAILPLPEFNVGIQPGIMYKFNDRISLLTEITLRVGNKADADSEAVDKKYLRIQPELRYNLRSKKRIRNDYLGFRFSYASRSFSDVNGGFYATQNPGDEGFFYDRAKINSPVVTSSIQYGTILSSSKRFSIDVFIGLGLRFVNTEYTDVSNPIRGTRTRSVDGPTFYASYSYNGSLIWFHVNGGLRLFWNIR